MNGDYQQVLQECQIELQFIQRWVSENSLDSKVRYFTSYAVIKACGTIELVLKHMLYDYLSIGANQEAKMLLNKNTIGASFNPNPQIINNFLGEISDAWGKAFDKKTKGRDEKGQLKSLVNLRNDFSHGASITASINDVIDYFNAGIWILQKVDETMDNKM